MNNKLSKRIPWIDNIRVFAMLMVILGHSLTSPNASSIVRWIIAFNMPLFVIISGYCAYHNMSKQSTWKDLPAFIEKTTKHILFPALMGTMALSLIHQVEDKQWLKLIFYLIANILGIIIFIKKDDNKVFDCAFKAILSFSIVIAFSKSPYWFLTMTWTVLVVFKLITIFVHKTYLVAILAFGIAIAYSYVAKNAYFISEFFIYFFVGMMLRKYSDKKININQYFILTLCLLIGIETYSFCGNQVDFYKISLTDLLFSSNWYYWILRQIGAICWSLMFIILFKGTATKYSSFSFIGGVLSECIFYKPSLCQQWNIQRRQ